MSEVTGEDEKSDIVELDPSNETAPLAVGDFVVGRVKSHPGVVAGLVARTYPDGRVDVHCGVWKTASGVETICNFFDDADPGMVQRYELPKVEA